MQGSTNIPFFPQSLFLCPSLLSMLSLPLVSIPFLLACLPFSFLRHVFYFCFLCQLGFAFLFFFSFPPEITLRPLSNLVFRFLLWKTSLRWCLCGQNHANNVRWILAGFWCIWIHLHLTSTPGSAELSLLLLSSICLISGCRLLLLDLMDFSSLLLLNPVNKNFCTQQRNKPSVLYGNCMCSAFYQWLFLNQHHKNCHSIRSTSLGLLPLMTKANIHLLLFFFCFSFFLTTAIGTKW